MSGDLLILGAGPTGLAVAKALADRGLDYIQVEARDAVGGNWVDGVYESAHLISSKETTQYADFPMPAAYPDFPSAAQMRTYFHAYAERFGLLPKIRFGVEVTSVRPAANGDGWDVTLRERGGEVTSRHFRGVIVCNGHHWKKSFPPWASAFTGEALHSKDYEHADQLRGKRVLVVGGGNSGCDIVSEAARVATSTDWSLRRGYWFIPKTIFGVPTIQMLKPWLPVPLQRAVMRALLPIVVGPYATYGLPRPDHKIFEAHPSVSTEVFHYLKHGRITPRPDVASVDGRRVTFVGTDGTRELPPGPPGKEPGGAPKARGVEYDMVVFATGFDVSFPFLPDGMVPIVGKAPQLYGSMVLPEHRHLWIVGAYQPRYGIGPLLTPLGRLIAALVPLQDELVVPLGKLLQSLGVKPPTTHLVDPHAALRRLAVGLRAVPFLRWQARRRGWLAPQGAGNPDHAPKDGASSSSTDHEPEPEHRSRARAPITSPSADQLNPARRATP
ncbi:MAG: NAD(P)-binding domain-containing protein [Deltaproteobacteria bacterium]|nr:NAD(P)-binding domain-containing protein [Deltaproteobacteria bacterium]